MNTSTATLVVMRDWPISVSLDRSRHSIDQSKEFYRSWQELPDKDFLYIRTQCHGCEVKTDY